VEDKERMKKLEKILEKLRGEWIFVEGKKDKEALKHLGFENILTISGNLRQSCRKVHAEKVFVLTDLDRRGDQLAMMAKDELESNSVRADLEARKKLAFLLRIRFFEDAYRAYKELKGEIYG
jgi:5S rRNA maturation endonuclease (ribonuclease M5)